MEGKKLTLHYLAIYGRGEPIRMLLSRENIPFDDKTCTYEELNQYKKQFEFHSLPVLDIDGVQLAQTEAIMAYLGRQYGYYPEDKLQAYYVDSLF